MKIWDVISTVIQKCVEPLFLLVQEKTNKLQPESKTLSLLTYKSCLEYFITDRPSNPNIAKGAILRENHPKGQLVTQVFLDKNNQLTCDSDGNPYGRKLFVENFDDELNEAFSNKSMIIIE